MLSRTLSMPLFAVTAGAVVFVATLTPALADDKKDKKEDKTKIYHARMETSHGVIELELNREKAKETVDNFLKYVESDYYEGTLFHRVEKGYIVQGGGFRKNSKGDYVPKSTGDRKAIKSQSNKMSPNLQSTVTNLAICLLRTLKSTFRKRWRVCRHLSDCLY